MIYKALIAYVCALIVAATSYASEDEIRCDHTGTQIQMTQCAHDDETLADKALNLTYRKKMNTLDAAGQLQLRREQRAWLKTLERDCQKEANIEAGGTMEKQPDGSIIEVGRGSMWPMVYLSCRAEAKIKRTNILMEHL